MSIETMKDGQCSFKNLKLAHTASSLDDGLFALSCNVLDDGVIQTDDRGGGEDVGELLE